MMRYAFHLLGCFISTAVLANGPIDNHHFAPGNNASAALHEFSGTIRIPEHAMQSMPANVRPADINGKKTQLFPGVKLEFVSHDGYLVPLARDIIEPPGSDSFWQIHVAPGRVWSDAADDGRSRAAFPFFLTNLYENETYNGLARFTFDDVSVSPLRYQIIQQLSPFLVKTRFVAWNELDISYEPGKFNTESIIAEFEAELADRLTWRPWSKLQDKYGADLFSDFHAEIDASLVVADGLVIDGEVYVHSMATPYGDYPYPREMRHGVWSVTKTSAGLVTLLRMAQKYGDEILDYRIKDYVDVTAEHDGWENVTLRHAMSMATGVGPGTTNLDPNNFSDGNYDIGYEGYIDWYFARSAQAKLDELFKVPDYPWGPGEVPRYRDRDIFLGSVVMANLYREREGPDADLWQMMLDEVYRPIGIHYLPKSRTWETDRPRVPLLAWGVYLSVDDVAKIGALLLNGGKHDGVQLLSRTALAEALYQTAVRGLPTGDSNQYGTNSYHLTVWHENFRTASSRVFTIPTMRGYGGNVVKLMPNGIIGFRMGNGGHLKDERMIAISDEIRPFDDYPQLAMQEAYRYPD